MGRTPACTQCLVFIITFFAAVLLLPKDVNVRVNEMDLLEGDVEPMMRGVTVLRTYGLAHGRLCLSKGSVVDFMVCLSFSFIRISYENCRAGHIGAR